MALLRFFACAIVIVGSVLFYVTKNESAAVLILFPLIGIVPAAIYTAVVLAPLERFAVTHEKEWHLIWALPLAGALLPFVTITVLAIVYLQPSAIANMVRRPAAIIPALMGSAYGLLWWLTGVIARLSRTSDDL